MFTVLHLPHAEQDMHVHICPVLLGLYHLANDQDEASKVTAVKSKLPTVKRRGGNMQLLQDLC